MSARLVKQPRPIDAGSNQGQGITGAPGLNGIRLRNTEFVAQAERVGQFVVLGNFDCGQDVVEQHGERVGSICIIGVLCPRRDEHRRVIAAILCPSRHEPGGDPERVFTDQLQEFATARCGGVCSEIDRQCPALLIKEQVLSGREALDDHAVRFEFRPCQRGFTGQQVLDFLPNQIVAIRPELHAPGLIIDTDRTKGDDLQPLPVSHSRAPGILRAVKRVVVRCRAKRRRCVVQATRRCQEVGVQR